MAFERHQQQWRKRTAKPARSPHEALCPRMLSPGKPARYYARGVWISARRAYAEEETRAGHLHKRPAPAAHCGEARPPDRDACQLQALAISIAQRSGGNLE